MASLTADGPRQSQTGVVTTGGSFGVFGAVLSGESVCRADRSAVATVWKTKEPKQRCYGVCMSRASPRPFRKPSTVRAAKTSFPGTTRRQMTDGGSEGREPGKRRRTNVPGRLRAQRRQQAWRERRHLPDLRCAVLQRAHQHVQQLHVRRRVPLARALRELQLLVGRRHVDRRVQQAGPRALLPLHGGLGWGWGCEV